MGKDLRKKYRVNEQIRAREVRLIGPDSKQIGIVSLSEALRYAEDYGLDLVEVAPSANPPVCKIMDFGEFLYQEAKKAKEAKKRLKNFAEKEGLEKDFKISLQKIKNWFKIFKTQNPEFQKDK